MQQSGATLWSKHYALKKCRTLKLELEGAIGILTLNVPEKLNAHTKKMRLELLHFWRERQNNEKECRG